MSEDKKLTVEMSVYQAAAVREELFTTTKMFTYDPKCVPPRVVKIREIIVKLDELIEESLEDEKTDS